MAERDDVIPIDIDYIFQDKSGRDITFKIYEDNETPNRGLQVDHLRAYHEDELVGYLKVMYTTKEKMKEFFPSGVLNFIDQHGGTSLFEFGEGYEKAGTDIKALSLEGLQNLAKKLHDTRYAQFLPEKEIKSYFDFGKWLKASTEFSRSFQQQLEDYKAFQSRLNTPIVYYINTRDSTYNGVPNDNRSLGIGTILYKIMAKELQKKDLKLYSSVSQTPEAQAAWKKMTENGYVEKSRKSRLGKRFFINPDKFELNFEPPKFNI